MSEYPPGKHGQNPIDNPILVFGYIPQATIIFDALVAWLEKSEDERYAEILDSLDRLNSLLPESLKVTLIDYSYDPSVDEPFDGSIRFGDLVIESGIQIVVTDGLKRQLIGVSTQEAIVTLVQIAVKIIETSSKGNVVYRDSLRKELLEFVKNNRNIFGDDRVKILVSQLK